MDDHPVDLSTLDPSRDEVRWAALVDAVASRAWAVGRQRLTLSTQVAHWSRPALAIAAALAMFCWMGSHRDATVTQLGAAEQLSDWAAHDTRPATSDIITVLGEDGDGGH